MPLQYSLQQQSVSDNARIEPINASVGREILKQRLNSTKCDDRIDDVSFTGFCKNSYRDHCVVLHVKSILKPSGMLPPHCWNLRITLHSATAHLRLT